LKRQNLLVVIRVHADAEAVVVVLDAKVARESALAHAELAEELVPYLAVGWRDAGTDTSSLQRRQSRANAQTCTTPQSQRLIGSSESSAACRQGRGAGGETAGTKRHRTLTAVLLSKLRSRARDVQWRSRHTSSVAANISQKAVLEQYEECHCPCWRR